MLPDPTRPENANAHFLLFFGGCYLFIYNKTLAWKL